MELGAQLLMYCHVQFVFSNVRINSQPLLMLFFYCYFFNTDKLCDRSILSTV